MATSTDYPNLRRYLKSARVADFVRGLKNPENWFRWLGVVGTMWALAVFHLNNLWVVIAIFVLGNLGQVVCAKLRLGGKTFLDLYHLAMAEKLKANLPRIVDNLLARGTLVERVGKHQVELLDRCGRHANDVVAAVVQMRMLGPKLPNLYRVSQLAASESADAAFRQALQTMQPSLVFHQSPDPESIGVLERIETSLSELAVEIQALSKAVMRSDDEISLQPLVDRLRAMREFEEGLNQHQEPSQRPLE